MRRRPLAGEQARVREEECPRADRGQSSDPRRHAAQPRPQRRIPPRRRHAFAAGDEQGVDPVVQTLDARRRGQRPRSEEHTSELQSLMRNSYAVFCLKKKTKRTNRTITGCPPLHHPPPPTTLHTA